MRSRNKYKELHYILKNGTSDSRKGFLRNTCLAAQDKFKEYLRYFEVDFLDDNK